MKDNYKCEKTGIKFVKIPHPENPFFMSIYPITQKIWTDNMGNKPYLTFKGRGLGKLKKDNNPIIRINWHHAKEFCDKLGFLLPTEEQWKFAAGDFPAEDSDFNNSWYYDNSNKHLHEVGRKFANKHGLYDMYGNVWEFTSSHYKDNKNLVLIQGGCFLDDYHDLEYCKAVMPSYNNSFCGFRVILP